jgi:hypothetical protein
MTPRPATYLSLSAFVIVLAPAPACQRSRPPAPTSAAPAGPIKEAPPGCSGPDSTCPEGQRCIAYHGYSGQQQWSCDIPCGAARSCPAGMACFDYDDGPENVCRPYRAPG